MVDDVIEGSASQNAPPHLLCTEREINNLLLNELVGATQELQYLQVNFIMLDSV